MFLPIFCAFILSAVHRKHRYTLRTCFPLRVLRGFGIPQRQTTTYIIQTHISRLSLTIYLYIFDSIYTLSYNSIIETKYAFFALGVTIHIHLLQITSFGIITIHGKICISSQHWRHSYLVIFVLVFPFGLIIPFYPVDLLKHLSFHALLRFVHF